MAPEQPPGTYPSKQVKQEDLLKVDTWQLGINLLLNDPFDTEFDRMTDIPEFPDEFIANYLDVSNLPVMSDRYYFQR